MSTSHRSEISFHYHIRFKMIKFKTESAITVSKSIKGEQKKTIVLKQHTRRDENVVLRTY